MSESQVDSSGKDETKNGKPTSYKQYHEQMVNSLKAESVEEFSRRPHDPNTGNGEIAANERFKDEGKNLDYKIVLPLETALGP
ncbi:hypothetical protein OS493_038649 [Desmophyllum pertusum]|uniref:Uncharacterized protein n=1 Tax=Desmophyllum pertusum TaxID=174260 RepID=A0A9W9Z6E2_9CNID|nr:hypothetical protein OS493_038649 [Desmophyllum pertusum]